MTYIKITCRRADWERSPDLLWDALRPGLEIYTAVRTTGQH